MVFCDNVIDEIECARDRSSGLLKSIKLDGVIGISLFYLYRYLESYNHKYITKIESQLDYVFSYMNDQRNSKDISIHNLIELSKYMHFLSKYRILSQKDLTDYSMMIEPACEVFKEKKCLEKNLDSLDGLIFLGHYYLESMYLPNRKLQLSELIREIKRMSIPLADQSLYWKTNFRNCNRYTIESGFFHGMSGVWYFLALSFRENILPDICADLIYGSIKYVNKYYDMRNVNCYPIELQSFKRIFYHNLAYGDVGIAYSLYKTGLILKETRYIDLGLNLLIKTSLFRDNHNCFIKDAELVYGSSGLFAVFDELHKETQLDTFLEAREYWLTKTLQYGNTGGQWAGFETYINGFDNDIQLSFSHGICGIGIALISNKINCSHLDYLSFINFK